MNIFVAVAENRDDPLKLGRCQIRIFGKHTDDKTILPTSDLPWAIPMQGIGSAGSSGIGLSPTGIVPGSWVLGMFIDGEDEQQPIMLGTIGTGNAGATGVLGAIAKSVSSAISTVGNVIKDSVSPITTNNIPQPTGWTLGQTSKKFESGNNGPGTINPYANSGDYGGASYGLYQFASYLPTIMPSGKARKSPKNSPIVQYCTTSKFSSQFAGLSPATPEFDAKWKEIAAKYPDDFAKDQHQCIEDNYYKVLLGKLKNVGLDMSGFGAGVQDLVWATSVQFGGYRTDVFTIPLSGISNLDEATIITKVEDYKIANVNSLYKSSSQAIKDALRVRFIAEKAALLKLAAAYPAGSAIPVTPAAKVVAANAATAAKDAPAKSSSLPYSPLDDTKNKDKLANANTGYSDPDGAYPKPSYSDHPDINKLATGRIDGTAAEQKINSRVVGVPLPGGTSFDQPSSTFSAKYPFNKVVESEAGHVIEIDDTPGAERINVWHKSGSFVEIDAVGNMVRRSAGSMYELIDRNGYLYVQGKCNISVGGACNLMVSADANIEVVGDAKVSVGNNVTVEAAGRMSLSAGEAIDIRSKNIYIEADEQLHIVGDTSTHIMTPIMHMKADDLHVQSDSVNVKVDGAIVLQSDSLSAKADDAIVMQSDSLSAKVGGNTVLESSGKIDLKVGSDLTLDTAGQLSLRAAGDVRMDGSTFDWNVGGSHTAASAPDASDAAEAEDAEYSEAGLIEDRKSYQENIVADIKQQNTKVEAIALNVETPHEIAVASKTQTAELVKQGIASTKELSVVPSVLGAPDVSSVLTVPKISIPGLGDITNTINSLTSSVSGAVSSAVSGVTNGLSTSSIPGVSDLTKEINSLTGSIGNQSVLSMVTGTLNRVRNLDLPTGDMAVLQKLLHSGVDISRLNSIPPSVTGGFDLGGIGLGKSVQIPGLNLKIIQKIRSLHLTEKEIKILKAIDLLNIKKMDLSSPQGVLDTMRGMTGELMKFGAYNPELNKITKVMQNLSRLPAKFKLSPNFDIAGLSIGTKVTGDKVVAQCGLTEAQISANMFGVAHNVLEPIKKAIPEIEVISGFRKDNGMGYVSQHFTGQAVDIRVPGASREEMFKYAQKIRDLVPFDQLGYEATSYNEGDWIHISFNNEGENRGEVFTIFNHKKLGDGLVQIV